MLRTRIMPCLLLRDNALVKTVRFRRPTYVGEPINTVRIYNEKCVDELIFLDITASAEKKEPPWKLLEDIASECFMPFTYGGGIRSVDDIRRITSLGVEKVVLNTSAFERPEFVREAASVFGSQSIVISIDAKRTWSGRYRAFVQDGKVRTPYTPSDLAVKMVALGAGEILLTSMDRDGTFDGYDLELVRSVSSKVTVPLVACGGAGSVADFSAAIDEGEASAVAAGSMFVYQGRNRSVLINFPTTAVLKAALEKRKKNVE